MSSDVFVTLTKHDITGQGARDKERQHKADRTEGGHIEREKNREWGPKKQQKGKMTAPKMS